MGVISLTHVDFLLVLSLIWLFTVISVRFEFHLLIDSDLW